MTDNVSLCLSTAFRERLNNNLLPAFAELMPTGMIEAYVKTHMPHTRDKVYTPSRTLFAMVFTGVQKDKSLQHTVNVFNEKYEEECKELQAKEARHLARAKKEDGLNLKKLGRPRLHKSRIAKSKTKALSDSTVAYSNARKRLPLELLKATFYHTNKDEENGCESWYGLHTYITDGTYVQLQDTQEIREKYPVVEGDGAYPQSLLQVFIRQGSGQLHDYATGSRKESELQLVIPMIKRMQAGDLLLADDLYNTYYHFHLIHQQSAHIIVPGKRERNYRVEKTLSPGDEIVWISKPKRRPDYVDREEWKSLPAELLLRRISYRYQTTEGMKSAVLYTTVLNEEIEKTEFVLKYTTRWEIEICIREIKTLMNLNVLRAKTPDMMEKELVAALIAYNLVRHLIQRAARKGGFPPQEDIFHRCAASNHPILLDRKGRVFHHWSTGRNKKVVEQNT
jgi:hypothetical protein